MLPMMSAKMFLLFTFVLTGVFLGQASFQSAQAIEPMPTAAASVPAPVDSPFNPETDSPTQRPTDREQTRAPYDDGRFVVGADERQPLLSRAFPWSAIGRLELQDASGQTQATCTGTLIAPDLLLTNAHCLAQTYLDPATNQPLSTFVSTERYQQQRQAGSAPKLVFKPIMIDGISLDEASVVSYQSGWREGGVNSTADDWAVLKLDTALGNDYGYLGWRSLDLNDSTVADQLAERALLVGYSGDFPTANLSQFGAPATTAGVDEYCSIFGTFLEGELANTFIHDCDMTPGASGGPILAQFADGNFYIIGLNAYQVSFSEPRIFPNGTMSRVTNAGVQPSRWMLTALKIRAR